MTDPQALTSAPWYYAWVSSLWLTVLAVLSGLVGGKLSVLNETDKLIKQRAFDVRLEWALRAVRSLNEVETLTANFRYAIRQGQEATAASVRSQLKSALARFDENNRESLLFASLSTVKTLSVLHNNLRKLLGDAVAKKQADPDANHEITNELLKAYLALAGDIRKHLKLEKLSESDMSP